ncbi:hypothetical protein ANANG_G00033710 [Anguilla anguilla]|uniref:WSC domain-containing protein n=1 Tax=Anguilla anguilla TaxID=7936 RepID=A0A9D3MW99_ANGAN|nr:hypothetical protein ANANG_G00033710 [Anguilla anguilla]
MVLAEPSLCGKDLSTNRISSLDASLFDPLTSLKELYLQGNRLTTLPRGIFGCGTLSVLDLSNNQISTLEERICDKLFNLTEINLSRNPFVCDCKLFRLVSWLQERGVRVRKVESMQCQWPVELRNQPVLNVSLLMCGLNYAACLPDSHTGVKELVIFTHSSPGNYTRDSCNAQCFQKAYRYGGLGAQRECLCSTNSEPNFISESQCSAACADPQVMKKCGWTVAHDVFLVVFTASFRRPLRFSLSARHKYALPGEYAARVALRSERKDIAVSGKVRVTLPPRLELACPPVVVANHSIDVGLVNWGGVGVAVDWRILLDGRESPKVSR